MQAENTKKRVKKNETTDLDDPANALIKLVKSMNLKVKKINRNKPKKNEGGMTTTIEIHGRKVTLRLDHDDIFSKGCFPKLSILAMIEDDEIIELR